MSEAQELRTLASSFVFLELFDGPVIFSPWRGERFGQSDSFRVLGFGTMPF